MDSVTRIDQLPPELDRRTFGAELYDLGKRVDTGLAYALLLPLTLADGRKSRCLIADERAHAARARYQRRPRRPRPERDDWYERAWALHEDDDTGDGAA